MLIRFWCDSEITFSRCLLKNLVTVLYFSIINLLCGAGGDASFAPQANLVYCWAIVYNISPGLGQCRVFSVSYENKIEKQHFVNQIITWQTTSYFCWLLLFMLSILHAIVELIIVYFYSNINRVSKLRFFELYMYFCFLRMMKHTTLIPSEYKQTFGFKIPFVFPDFSPVKIYIFPVLDINNWSPPPPLAVRTPSPPPPPPT